MYLLSRCHTDHMPLCLHVCMSKLPRFACMFLLCLHTFCSHTYGSTVCPVCSGCLPSIQVPAGGETLITVLLVLHIQLTNETRGETCARHKYLSYCNTGLMWACFTKSVYLCEYLAMQWTTRTWIWKVMMWRDTSASSTQTSQTVFVCAIIH